MGVKGIARATDVERVEFEIDGQSYWVEILKDPTAKQWNDMKTQRPGEASFDVDTRVLLIALQDWDLGVDITKEAVEDLSEPVRAAMVHLVTMYYLDLQRQHAALLERIYRPGGDDAERDPTSGDATASASHRPSRGSRRTR